MTFCARLPTAGAELNCSASRGSSSAVLDVRVQDTNGTSMTTLLDLLYVGLFAVALPLWDTLVSWPKLHRQLQADPARTRKRLWIGAIIYPWALVAVGAALWAANDRSWTSLGFSVPDGWRLWVAVGVVLLIVVYNAQAVAAVARDAETRASVRQQFSGELANVLPRTRTELYWFGGVSLTAGFCEEFMFRGYFIWAVAPWLGWWGAAALSLAFFASGHAYQGWNGVLRTGIFGALYTLVIAISNSLWPAIALHAVTDLGGGVMSWLALRNGQVKGDVMEVEKPTETQSASGVALSPGQAEPVAAPDTARDISTGSL